MTRCPLPALSAALALLLMTCAACGSDDETGHSGHQAKKVQADVFGIDRMLEVDIELAADDWEQLRFESPGLTHYQVPTCTTGPRPGPFTYRPATVTVDGHRFADAEVRKKGFKGTMNPDKPSLKVRLHGDDLIDGMRRLTLNNSAQDGNYVSQCLAYGLFAAAGLPAPRCGYAHVTVNGVDLGVYVHVESIRRPMIERTFGHFDGFLYENTMADFQEGMLQIFERKNREEVADRPELRGIQQALDGPDDQLLVALGKWLDLDAYFTYWAMEVLTGHWDGYHGNRNNNYAFFDATTGKMHFLPWGVDACFTGPWNFWGPFLNESTSMPRAVYAHGRIGKRLYGTAEGRKRYYKRLGELLATVWDEKALLARIDTMQATIVPRLTEKGAARAGARIDEVRAWIAAQRAALKPAVEGDPPEFTLTSGPLPLCGEVTLTVTGTFSTTWNTLKDNPLAHGSGALVAKVKGPAGAVTDKKLALVKGVAGPVDSVVDQGAVQILMGFGTLDGGKVFALQISLPVDVFKAGRTAKLNYGEAGADAGTVNMGTGKLTAVGFVLGGWIKFSKAGTGDGDEVAFEIEAPITRLATGI